MIATSKLYSTEHYKVGVGLKYRKKKTKTELMDVIRLVVLYYIKHVIKIMSWWKATGGKFSLKLLKLLLQIMMSFSYQADNKLLFQLGFGASYIHRRKRDWQKQFVLKLKYNYRWNHLNNIKTFLTSSFLNFFLKRFNSEEILHEIVSDFYKEWYRSNINWLTFISHDYRNILLALFTEMRHALFRFLSEQ